MRQEPYANRDQAGRELAAQLTGYAARTDAIVLGLPRGGVPVAVQVATALRLPLDVLVVRKLGLPGHRELAMGAVAGVGDVVEVVRNDPVLRRARVPESTFDAVYRREIVEVRRRESAYRSGRPALAVQDRVVILVDDGLATGSTMRSAVVALRRGRPSRLVVAVPVGPTDSVAGLREEVDELICLWIPVPFVSVGRAYRDFTQTPDQDVRDALEAAQRRTDEDDGETDA